jgi:hypothetical protein
MLAPDMPNGGIHAEMKPLQCWNMYEQATTRLQYAKNILYCFSIVVYMLKYLYGVNVINRFERQMRYIFLSFVDGKV